MAQPALGAAGMAFVEFAPDRRSGDRRDRRAEWTIGRPLPADDPATVCLLSGPRVRQARVDRPQRPARRRTGRPRPAPDGGRPRRDRRAHRRQPARALPGPTTSRGPGQHAVIGYLASCIAHMYGDQSGLPVHGDGPVVAALADGLAVVDRGGHVRLWNPAAAQVTGRRAAEALNRPLPFPLPPVRPGPRPPAAGRPLAADHLRRAARPGHAAGGHLPRHHRPAAPRPRPGPLRRGDQPRAAYPGHRHQGVRGHPHRPLGVADRRRPAAGGPGDRAARQRAGPAGRPAAHLGHRGGARRRPAGPVRPRRGAARPPSPTCPATCAAGSCSDLPVDLPKALGRPAQPGHRADRADHQRRQVLATRTPRSRSPPSADGQTVSFRVSDRGIGIRPEHVERAFDRFWQGESGDRRGYPGAGLGLYLVRRIVEQQNGWVSLRPRTGGGTVAEVRLPRG